LERGVRATAATTLAGPDGPAGVFGVSVARAGDVDGDGRSDVVIGSRDAATLAGRVYVYPGGAAGVSTTPAATRVGPDGEGAHFGNSVANAGDATTTSGERAGRRGPSARFDAHSRVDDRSCRVRPHA
jgi:hypothetical protein